MRAIFALLAALASAPTAFACLVDGQAALPSAPGPFLDADHRRAIEDDIKLGRRYAEEIDAEFKRTKKAGYQERIDRIGAEIAQIANANAVEVAWGDRRLNAFPYEYRVVEGEDVNAFSLPGGVIYINEGLIDFAESDDEIAGVIAHEVSHASFRHIAQMRRESRTSDALQIPLILAAILTQSGEAFAAATAGQLAGQAMQSGWSLSAETAADLGGLQYVEKSRWNPVGMLTFMERLAWQERNRPRIDWGIYSTHPPSIQRAAGILNRLVVRQEPIRRSAVSSSMAAEARPDDEGGVAVWFGDRLIHTFRGGESIDRADAAVERLNAFFDQEPGLFDAAMDDGLMIGMGEALFQMRREDAAKGEDEMAMIQAGFRRLRSAIYELQFKLWPAAELLRYRGG
jgi:predicted Zn-dependent protease